MTPRTAHRQDLHPIVAQMQPNDEQLAAIVARGSDLLLSAGAGSGKTRTLTARVLSLLAEGIPLRAIVAVTFTIKAASEMRNRLRTEMQRYLARTDLAPGEATNNERRRWRQIALEMDGARIGTIHSLCSEILRIHAAEAGIDPRFTVLDESATRLRKRMTVDALLMRIGDDAEYAPLVETMGLELLGEALMLLLDDAQRAARLLDPANETRIRAALEVWEERTRAYIAEPAVAQAIADLREAVEEAGRSDAAAHDGIAPWLQPTLDHWENAQRALEEGEPLLALAELSSFAALPKNKGRRENWITSNPKTALQTLRSTCESLLPLPANADPRADLALLTLLPALRALHARAQSHYAEDKRQQRALDFDDLEAMASTLLLQNAAVRAEWQREVQALLVDEFQDTNGRQRDLLRAIAGDRGVLFMVGDAKQSIYRFRGADVRVFRSERTALEAGAGTSMALAHSFRSHPNLLQRLNTLLAEALPPAEGDDLPPWVEPFAPLIAGKTDEIPALNAPFVEVHLGVGTKSGGAMEIAADALAARLWELHRAGTPWEAMALLCRRVTSFAPYEDAFERFGIPYVTTAGAGFHQRPEVRDLLNALRALADPADNQALAGFLRSPMVGMSDGDLLLLHERIAPPGSRVEIAPGAWWAAVQEFQSAAASLGTASRAVALVREVGQMVGRTPVSALIAALLERTGYEAALIAAGNHRAARNLAKLLEDAQRTPQASVRAFLAEIHELSTAGARTGEARTEAAGSVQIMTIHAAKGLEFPVVVIGDAGGRPQGRQTALMLDETHGLLFPAGEGGAKGILYQQAAELDGQMEEAEAGRLLYVAATRAQERLIVSGTARLNAEGVPQPEHWLRTLAGALGLDQPISATIISTSVVSTTIVSTSIVTARDAIGAPPPSAGPLVTRTRETLIALHRESPEPPAPLPETARAVATGRVQAVEPPLLQPLPHVQGEQVILADEEGPLQRLEDMASATDDDGKPSRPPRAFLRSETLSPWQYQQIVGSIFHSALQWGHTPEAPAFSAWMERALDRYDIADAGERKRIADRTIALLRRYHASDLCREVAAATDVLREVEFISLAPQEGEANKTRIPHPAQQPNLFAEAPADPAPPTPHAMHNGRIDLLYRRADGTWVIVDFKVDRIVRVKDTLRHLAARTDYLRQVRHYRQAFEALTGESAEAYLCLLDDHGALKLHRVT